jgi:hypothetical protein
MMEKDMCVCVCGGSIVEKYGSVSLYLLFIISYNNIGMFSRFHDDPARIRKQMAQSTYAERYFLNTPGQGLDLPFFEDPQIRLQQWGGNLYSNPVLLEGELRGIDKKLNRDYLDPHQNGLQFTPLKSRPNSYGKMGVFIDESRASCPAWMFRDLEISRWENPLLNPQNGLEKPFLENIQTRIIEKDSYIATPLIPFPFFQ